MLPPNKEWQPYKNSIALNKQLPIQQQLCNISKKPSLYALEMAARNLHNSVKQQQYKGNIMANARLTWDI